MIRLFLADDMPAVREVMRICLHGAPDRYQVVGEAGNGLDALDSIHRLQPDVIILDVDMPGMNGLDVVRELRGQGFGMPVILCSSWEGPTDSDLPQGVARCLRKPFPLGSLTEAVEAAAGVLVHPD
ncbi:MAG TPA: response regulator [Candidatus Sulfotelmatobacter sp.]|nr:response regulator [Candidatus Sulfotelmatobacter sp.]